PIFLKVVGAFSSREGLHPREFHCAWRKAVAGCSASNARENLAGVKPSPERSQASGPRSPFSVAEYFLSMSFARRATSIVRDPDRLREARTVRRHATPFRQR